MTLVSSVCRCCMVHVSWFMVAVASMWLRVWTVLVGCASRHLLLWHRKESTRSKMAFLLAYSCLKCPDAVGWASGTASGLLKSSHKVLAWLFVWNKVQMICIWSNWCHCHPVIFCFIKIQIGSIFPVLDCLGCPGKRLSVCPVVLKLSRMPFANRQCYRNMTFITCWQLRLEVKWSE